MNNLTTKRFLLWVLTGLFLSACSSTRIVNPGSELKVDRDAILVLNDSTRLTVYNVLVWGDSLVASDIESQDVLKYDVAEVQSIIVKHHLTGGFQGLFLGAILGAGSAYLLTSDSGWEEFFAVIFGGIGGVLGFVPGAYIGSREIFSLNPQGAIASPETPSAEPDSSGTTVEIQGSILARADEVFQNAVPVFKTAPANQVAGGFFYFPARIKPAFVTRIQYRRFFQPPDFLPFALRPSDRSYLSLGYRTVYGSSGSNPPEDWYSGSHALTFGLERRYRGNNLQGQGLFCELGILYGTVRTSESTPVEGQSGWYTSNDIAYTRMDLMGVAGGRTWSNRTILEFQIGFDTQAMTLVPILSAGFQF